MTSAGGLNGMKKALMILAIYALTFCLVAVAAEKEVEVKGKQLISESPDFTLTTPTEFRLVHSSSTEHPQSSSLTRAYLVVKEKDKQMVELLTVEIAERTNPQAEPIHVPSLKPLSEERMYSRGSVKKEERAIDYLVQGMAWNPAAPSLQPIVKAGIRIPGHWVLHGQFLFVYDLDRAVLVRYSKDVNAFGVKLSDRAESWNKASIAGNEKKVLETFQKNFVEMVNSITFKKP